MGQGDVFSAGHCVNFKFVSDKVMIENDAMLESRIMDSERTQKEVDDEIKKKKENQVTENELYFRF